MYTIKLQWKGFNVNLSEVDTWLRTHGGQHYIGNVATDVLTLWFHEEPDLATRIAILEMWEAVDEAHHFATRYITNQQKEERVAALKASALTKKWDQLTVAERKLILGITPTLPELGL